MKGFLRKLMTLGVLGGMGLGVAMGTPQMALALSSEAIAEKLAPVPVFMILDQDGRSLTANVETENNGEVSVPIVFISVTAAESFLAEARAENAPIGEAGQVAILSLGALYQEATTQLSSGQGLAYIPASESVAAAEAIANGQDFRGVPLFAAVNLETNQYLFTTEGVLPVYFSIADLQATLAPLLESNPELQDVIGVEVLTLEGLIAGMESNDRELDQLLERVRLIPDSTTVDYLRQGSQE